MLNFIANSKVGKHIGEFWQIVEKYSNIYKQKEESLIGYWFLSHRNEMWGRIV